VNFPFICSNIPAAPAYGAYISQLVWYSRACGSYQDYLDRNYWTRGSSWLSWSHHDMIDRYGISLSQMTMDMFHLSEALPGPFPIHDISPGLNLD
jgi:hypothetical protein